MGTIELRGFATLQQVLHKKGFAFPQMVEIGEGLTGDQLISKLDIKETEVEALFVNGRVQGLHDPIQPGDRVALVPPGTPGPYRVILGIVGKQAK
ncbi:MoaD/ThiS family protein [Desulforamulus ruminis]|uniref:ThiamineS protein n=1 Tax=Desulforamulus ruminis (strain ATCC 23193 / DSM 2154 / NCIMB 8452 / DL) TaxID=696281 RepID=F6DQ80_DESRL|nr:MoaD/ThiS family protein [Desulforamulus ruminis]AEG59658.1 thiamineS protein [Desulforamulus ruminis DSM 2154]